MGSKRWDFSESEGRLCALKFAALRRSSPSFEAKIEQPGFDFLFPVLFPTARRLPMCEGLCLVWSQDLCRCRFVYSPANRPVLSRSLLWTRPEIFHAHFASRYAVGQIRRTLCCVRKAVGNER